MEVIDEASVVDEALVIVYWSVVDGPVITGPVIDGPVVDGPLIDLKIEGPAIDGPMILGNPSPKIPNPHRMPNNAANNPINPHKTQQTGEQHDFFNEGSSYAARFL